MKVLLSLIALTFSCNYVGAQVPDCSTAANGAQFPDPNSCSSFYLCIFGETVLKYCSYGLHFDPSKNNCILPSEIGSGRCSLREICLINNDGYKFPHKNCDKFYLCHQHSPIVQQCPALLYFDYTDSTCKPPEQISGPCNIPRNICTNQENGAMLAHPDKTKFYLCIDGEARIVDCDHGLIFDEKKQFCVKPGIPKGYLFSCNGRKLYQ